MTSLELRGLKGNHPRGFLAACGLLRCYHQWRDSDPVTLAWRAEHRVALVAPRFFEP
jgi:hypothetical protein